MLKKFLTLILFLPFIAFAQQISTPNLETKMLILEKGQTQLSLESQIGEINFTKKKYLFNEYYLPEIEGFTPSLLIGNPNLPVVRKLVEIPQNAQTEIQVLYIDSIEYSLSDFGINAPIMPRLASTPKNQSPDFIINESIYKINDFIGEPTISFDELGTMRDSRLGRLSIAHFKYNPVQNKIRVYTKIRIKINFTNANIAQTTLVKKRLYSPYFNGLSNGTINADAYTLLPSQDSLFAAKYIIIADTMFRSSLQEFIKWKRIKGFDVMVAYTSDTAVGKTTSSIKNFLKNIYLSSAANQSAPSFVLFVGDTAQIPVFTGIALTSHFTDLYYCEYTNDEFPEVLYGRFSANTVSQLVPQIEKTIEYEKYLMADPNFLSNSILVAGIDNTFSPTHANGQINYLSSNYFNAAHSITPKIYLYPTSSGNASQIIQNFNQGAAIVNYTGHGLATGWDNPAFSNNTVAGLTNAGKYPLVITNACITNKFDVSECFTEALVRAPNKGAIAAIGASNNTYWDEDFYWAVGFGTPSANQTYANTGLGAFDCMFHDHGEASTNWAIAASQILKAGNLAVTQSASSVRYYWEIYHLMGDPSLLYFSKLPSSMFPVFSSIIVPNLGYHVFNTEPHALVAISRNDTLLGSAFADSLGFAQVFLPISTALGSVSIVITAQNFIPFFGTAIITNPTGPYISGINPSVNDKNQNNNGLAEYGEVFSLDLDLNNVTSFVAQGVKLQLFSSDTSIQILDSIHYLGSMLGNSLVSIDSIFKIQVNELVNNGHVSQLNLSITDTNANHWNSIFNITLYAPDIKIVSLVVNDSAGNNNGLLEVGESAKLEFMIKNEGGCDALNVNSLLQSSISSIQVNGTPSIDTLMKNSLFKASFNVQVGNNIFFGSVVDFTFKVNSGMYQKQQVFSKLVGNVNEDFETGTLTKYPWNQAVKNPWNLNQSNVYQGLFTVKSKVIGNLDTSNLQVTMNVLSNDSISFFRMVSSEKDYDYLVFSIDNSVYGKWSGSVSWGRVSFPVLAGQHTFKWSYIKDYYGTSGSDAALVDFISFPANNTWLGLNNSPINNLALQVFPNPTINKLTILFNLNEASKVKTKLIDINGAVVRSFEYPCLSGSNSFELNLTGVSSGIYFLILQSDFQIESKKIVIIEP